MIYLDNSATTRPYDAVTDGVARTMRESYFNASAAYGVAIAVEKEVRATRALLAQRLGAQPGDVCFTSGGTEADILAILGTLERRRKPGNVVLSAIEHPAVSETVRRAEAMGHEIRTLPVDHTGLVDLPAARALIDEHTLLLSCMQVSNETGAIQPIQTLAELARHAAPEICIHVDGVQGFLRVPIHLEKADVDFYALSGHKIHAPKGIGALVARKKDRLAPQMTGGGQEGGLRSGTLNTPGIIGLGIAVRQTPDEARHELRALKLRLWAHLANEDGMFLNGPDPADASLSAPHILSVSFDGVRGEVLRNALEAQGILVSTGSACSSHRQKVSSMLLSMGLSRARADGTIRISLGRFNTPEEMDQAADQMCSLYRQLRKFQRR